MTRALYTIESDSHRKQVLANSFAQVITWAESPEAEFSTGEHLRITRHGDLVDLIGERLDAPLQEARTKSAKPQAARAERPRKAAKAAIQSPDGELSNADAANRLGVNMTKIRNAKYTGALKSGSYGHITIASIEEYEAKRSAPVATKASNDTPGLWRPAPQPSDKMLHEDKVAAQLKLTVSQLREVKRNGNIPGGNGWVNLTVLEAYMAHKDYEPPFATA